MTVPKTIACQHVKTGRIVRVRTEGLFFTGASSMAFKAAKIAKLAGQWKVGNVFVMIFEDGKGSMSTVK